MRELNFRIGRKLGNGFRYLDKDELFNLYRLNPYDGSLIVRDNGRNVVVPKETYVIEQYTGLKDKNGKMIYEGDIVEALIDGVWNTGRNTVSFGKAKWKLEVVYDNARFMDVFKIIGSKSNPDRIYYLFDKELSEIKVIYNIHQNPELLESE